jgi:hypothetical protein
MLPTGTVEPTVEFSRCCSPLNNGACLECPRRSASSRLRPRAGEHMTLLPAILVALLPKCPLCLAAWLGIFGSVGSVSWFSATWGTPLCAALLSLAVGVLALRAWSSRDPRPFVIALIGATVLLGGKCRMDVPLLVYGGLAMFIAGALGSFRLKPSEKAGCLATSPKHKEAKFLGAAG